MEEELVNFLLANSALAALVVNRIDWLQRPQGAALPSITLQVASAPRDYTLKGRVGLVGRLIQIDVWGSSYASMKATARALVTALDGLRDAPFRGAFIESEDETFEAGDAADASGSTNFYRTRFDVRVVHFSAD